MLYAKRLKIINMSQQKPHSDTGKLESWNSLRLFSSECENLQESVPTDPC